MTREMGKVLNETRGDVQEGIDTAYYAATEGRRLFGHTVPSELRDKWAMTYRRPIGVAASSPLQLPAGDPDVEDVPGARLREQRHPQAGRGRAAHGTCSSRSCSRPGCRRRSSSWCTASARRSAPPWSSTRTCPDHLFTGSTETGSQHRRVCGRMHKRLSLEMGGKNAQIVMPDADMDLALDGVLWGAFGTTGQRCTATSRLLLHDDIHDEFLDGSSSAPRKLRLGDGLEDGSRRRPAHQPGGAATRSAATSTSRAARRRGADRRRRAPGGGPRRRLLLRADDPRGVRPGSRLACEEVFGPVLSVIRFSDLDEAIRINNEVRVRPLQLHLHARRARRVPRHERARQRHHLRQRADHRRRGAPAVRRRQEDRQRPPRGRLGGLRVLLGDQGLLRRLLRAGCSARRSTTTTPAVLTDTTRQAPARAASGRRGLRRGAFPLGGLAHAGAFR
jgi:alpha-ketoglutaric semialdehyde dehydrogenase